MAGVVLVVLVVLVAFLFGLHLIRGHLGQPVGLFDESIQLVGGMLVLQGQVPHRDFWSMYPPLNYYFNAGIFAVLGKSALSARILQCLFLVALIAFLALHAVERLRPSPGAGLIVSALAIPIIGDAFTYPYWNGYVLGLIGFLIYLRSLHETGRRKALLLSVSGVLIGLCWLCKINFGLYFISAVIATIGRGAFLSRGVESNEKIVRDFLAPAVLFLWPVALCAVGAMFVYWGLLSEVIDQVLLTPVRDMEPHRIRTLSVTEQPRYLLAAVTPLVWLGVRAGWISVAKPDERTLLSLALIVVTGAGVAIVGKLAPHLLPGVSMIVIALCFVGGYASKRLSQDEFAVLMCFAFFLHYLFVRADASHFAPLLPLAAILLPMVFSPGSTGGGELRNLASKAILTSLVVLLVVAKDFTHRSSVRYEQPISPTSPPTRGKEATNGAPSSTKDIVEETQGTRGRLAGAYGKIERLAKSTPSMLRAMRQGDSVALNANLLPLDSPLYSLFNEPDELKAIRLVYRLTSQTEPVYVGVRNHARVFINDIRAYWILDRRIAVRHFEMEPGIATEGRVQEEMKRDIEKNAVQWIILAENKQGDPDFERRAYEGSQLLNRFIANEFETVCVFGRYAVLERKPARARPHCTVGD